VHDKLRTAALAALLIGWSAAAPRIPSHRMPPRWHPIAHALFGAAVSVSVRAPLGLRPPVLWSGLRWGAVAAAPVMLAVAASAVIPRVREGMAARTLPAPTAPWLLLRIPIGTVWTEEATYRAALGTVATRAFGTSGGQLIAAAAFGLSHVPDAYATDESVPGTVLVTGAGGWIFGWLYARSGSLAAPMLVHLALNEAGAVAALAVQRRAQSGRG
jgi:uncharacterized protein